MRPEGRPGHLCLSHDRTWRIFECSGRDSLLEGARGAWNTPMMTQDSFPQCNRDLGIERNDLAHFSVTTQNVCKLHLTRRAAFR